MDRLGVVERDLAGPTPIDEPWLVPPVRFLDWTVNDELLRTMFGWGTTPDETTYLVAGWALMPALDWLTSLQSPGAGEFPDGRAAIQVCRLCGDLECGALSASIGRTDDVVTWADFGWQIPSEPGFEPLAVGLTLEFGRPEYESLISSLRHLLVTKSVAPSTPKRLWRKTESRRLIQF